MQLPATPAKAFEWIKTEDGTDVLAILHHQIEYSIFNPQTGTIEVRYPEVDMQGLAIQSLEIGEDEIFIWEAIKVLLVYMILQKRSISCTNVIHIKSKE
ncbi:hypothetical protein CV093_18490 [Oceanobacillus sp. 143]|nr:hypothetical protein CV093_18490 [Oceanobacillus sp. 143]